MQRYSAAVEGQMKALFDSLSEKDRRRYAAVEAVKLGYGGVAYISEVLCCDENTIRAGRAEIESLPEDPAADRIRKKGGPQAS